MPGVLQRSIVAEIEVRCEGFGGSLARRPYGEVEAKKHLAIRIHLSRWHGVLACMDCK